MGKGLNNVAVLFEPERIYLAGATGRQDDFFKGVQDAFTQNVQCTLDLCEADSVQAAIRTGLDAFLFSEKLNLSRWQPAAEFSA